MKKIKSICKKESSGQYFYKNYKLIRIGYYPPDKCVWWEAVDKDGNADYHANSKRLLKIMIDNDEIKEENNALLQR